MTVEPGDKRRRRRSNLATTGLLLSLSIWGCRQRATSHESIGPSREYAAIAARTGRLIEHELRDKGLPALSIALVDDQETVWAQGFGMADPDSGRPATAETVYRVGSVSKLFTDIAVMQLVERGEIDLDAPVSRYLDDFQPRNPFGKPVTLRQLMAHRGGLVREPPVGNYFDPTEPSLEQTVASLDTTELVYEPESRTKYSNAGIAVVGYVLERMKKKPFADYLQESVLEPLGMDQSGFRPSPATERALARAFMWAYDGRRFEAPRFELGIAPAGCMYTTVIDLGRFMSALFHGGQGSQGRVLRAETLEEMTTPQFAKDDMEQGFGIGFRVGELDGRRLIRHGGAIYGFATELALLPEEKLGAVVVTTLDAANSVVRRVANDALRSMLAVDGGKPLPELELPLPVETERARHLAGRYRSETETVELIERGGRLYLERGDIRAEVKALGDSLLVDGRLSYGLELVPGDDAVTIGGERFERIRAEKPRAAPEQWLGLIGEYGWDHNTLYILEKNGRLHALIEWFFFYPLEQISRDVFGFPHYGLYDGERLIFKRDENGKVMEVEAAGVAFHRRLAGIEEGETFQIEPLQPVETLREAAMRAEPPDEAGEFREPELVDVATLDPTIKLDIRYATTNNFMGASFYAQPRAFLQEPAARAVVAAHRALKEKGFGLLIHDAYRPWFVTKMFWDATPEEQKIFVADPSRGSRHNRGCAVDLTLYELATGRPVRMVGGYDEFSPRSYADYPGGTSLERWHREVLRDAMEARGFRVYEFEWWHFDYQDWDKYPILNLTFEDVTSRSN